MNNWMVTCAPLTTTELSSAGTKHLPTFQALIIKVPNPQQPTTTNTVAKSTEQIASVPRPTMPPDTEAPDDLPMGLFLLIMLAYLVAIGPVDFILVRMLKRPWLTWITFPCWLLFFYILGLWFYAS
jgi:hypothetical protein